MFSQISIPMDYWEWLNGTVLPELYLTQWYNGIETSSYDEKFLGNMFAMRLGPPRLRMLRTNEGMSSFNMLKISLLLNILRSTDFICFESY